MLSLLLAATIAAAPPVGASSDPAALNPHASELFERDPELSRWALRLFDANGDGWLTSYEAQTALNAFKEIADSNRDGRITVAEYEEAKRFIAARWALSDAGPPRRP